MQKVCVITGGGSGLGFEFSKLASADQYDVVLVDIDAGGLERAKETLGVIYGNKVETIQADLSLPQAADHVYGLIKEKPVEILINNAGFGLYGEFRKSSWETEEKMIGLHVVTPTRLMKLLIEDMVKRSRGMILNISSLASFQPGPFFPVYSASKAYLRSLSQAVATELKGSGVTVTVFCPGQTSTGFATGVAQRSGSTVSKVPLFTSPAGQVAAKGYRAMKKGKILAVPGFFNNLIAILSHIIPGTITAGINGRIQRRIRKR